MYIYLRSYNACGLFTFYSSRSVSVWFVAGTSATSNRHRKSQAIQPKTKTIYWLRLL